MTATDVTRLRRWLAAMTLCAAPVPAAATPGTGAVVQDALRAAGPQAAHLLDLWRLTLAICTLVFIAVVAVLLLALRRAPRGAQDTPPSHLAHRPEPGPTRSVVAGATVSLVLLFLLLVASVYTDRVLASLPRDGELQVELIGHRYWWEMRYLDPDVSRRFVTANELHVPTGRPVTVTLKADDVIHSFWVPNLVGKKDMIPGRTTTLSFRADRDGVYRGQCAEFCGAQHSWMALLVVAESPERYEAWAEAQRRVPDPPQDSERRRGLDLFLNGPCAMCHAVRGTTANAQTGPDLTHLASRRTLGAGRLERNADLLGQWISDPQRYKPGVNMPGHALPPGDLRALVAYLESLQ